MVVGVAELAVDHAEVLEVVADVVLVGHRDAAVDLHRLLADQTARLADLHLGRRDRLGALDRVRVVGLDRRQIARRGKHQRERVLGHRPVAVAGDVAHPDAEPP